ncbi:MAG: oxidoreductase [Gammaproteobacteria bacterium RIFCSPHIGHO2_12_FULL_37_34]|nr:MAG: oxidoreductase [Gammaproteobacteria bacterium RIFCSPHIGHO2_12_FULL_37_34]
MNDFKNKVIVITGGNSGMGKAIAEKFNQQQAKLVIFGRRQTTLNEAKQTLRDALVVQGDIKKMADIERLFKETKRAFGKIDVLIANAGIAARRAIQDVDEAFFDDIVDTNYKGIFFTVQRSLPYLKDGAAIILISSIASHWILPSHSVYSSAKAAVTTLARAFSADLIARNIRVNSISPGFIDTPIFDSIKKIDANYMRKRKKKIPIGCFGQSSDIAELAFFLASPKASYIVGADITIDGGVSEISMSEF